MTGAATGVAFPEPETLDWNAPCKTFGWPNLAFRGYSTQIYFPEHQGPLSIKCVFKGEEVYEIEGRRAVVDSASYLILNQGQRYSSHIDTPAGTESFCIFFHPDFARSVLRSLTRSQSVLLDNPASDQGQEPCFVERLYSHDPLVSPLLCRMRAAMQQGVIEPGWLEEQFYLLLENLLALHQQTQGEIEQLPAIRKATRMELYQRLTWAKEFMDASHCEMLSLTEIARVACLSPHHFLRQFKHLYQMTPHQYLTMRRLQTAAHLLRQTQMPVTDICMAVGFTSPGTFSHLFRRNYGHSPVEYRRQ